MTKLRFLFGTLLLAILLLPGHVGAATPAAPLAHTQLETILPPAGGGAFASALAVEGDTLIVGAPADTQGGTKAGAVYVFGRQDGHWVQQAKLPGSAAGAVFGRAVALSGSTLAVGAHNAVHIFVGSGANWSEQAVITTTTSSSPERFGTTVALDGDLLAVGIYRPYGGEESALLYRRTDATWSLEATLLGAPNTGGEAFGAALAVSGETVAVGAPNMIGYAAGAVYVFVRAGEGWSLQQKLTPGGTGAHSGKSLALEGDRLVIGAPGVSGAPAVAGAAYVVERQGNTWSTTATITSVLETSAGSFGSGVALSGSTILVGAPGASYDPRAGGGYVFTAETTGWSLAGVLPAHQPSTGHSLGAAVAVFSDTLVIGAPEASAEGAQTGAATTGAVSALTRAAPDVATTLEDTPLTLALLSNDVLVAGGDPISTNHVLPLVIGQPQHGLAAFGLDGTLTYTPTAHFAGVDTLRYQAGWGLPATVTITTQAQPDAPIFTSQPVRWLEEDYPYRQEVRVVDPDPGDRVTLTAPVLPAWMHFTPGSAGQGVLSGRTREANIGTHTVKLRAIDRTGRVTVQRYTVEVVRVYPLRPTNLAAAMHSPSQIRLTWRDQSDDELRFTIHRIVDGDWVSEETLPANSTSYIFNGLSCQVPYTFRVQAENHRGDRPSASVTATITDCTLVAPPRPALRVSGPGTVMLGWPYDTPANATYFSVQRSLDGVQGWQTFGRSTYPPVNDTGLSCGPRYYYRLIAHNAGASSPPGPVAAITACPPSAPTGLQAVAESRYQIKLNWTDTSGNETAFKLRFTSDGGASWHVLGLRSNLTTRAHMNLTCGTTYIYQLSAVNGAGQSPWSKRASATTQPCITVRHYVDASVVGGAGTGSSWADAFADLQTALSAADGSIADTIEIWVADGTYRPTAVDDRTASFVLRDRVALYGGFSGGETSLAERDWRAHETILSGEIGHPDSTNDNSGHVVSSPNLVRATVDGFTITGGANRYLSTDIASGGGILIMGGNLTLRHMLIAGNRAMYGGGIGVKAGTVLLEDVTLRDNTADQGGGAYFEGHAVGVFRDATIRQNSASTGGGLSIVGLMTRVRLRNVAVLGNRSSGNGGGIYNGGTLTLTNGLVSGNGAEYAGGGIYTADGATADLTNLTLAQNATRYGGALYNSYGAQVHVRNSILWGNQGLAQSEQIENAHNAVVDISDSLLEYVLSPTNGKLTGVRNRIADPLFVDANGADNVAGTLDDDLTLQPTSPAIDAGNNASVPAEAQTDLSGAPRFRDHPGRPDSGVGTAPVVDKGAYEYQP